jgi:hypothetical protein
VPPLGYDAARVRVRVQQAEQCYPPALLALLRATVASATANASVPDARLALLSAHFDARVRALVPVCEAYAMAAGPLVRAWAANPLQQTAPPAAAYVDYCRASLRAAAAAAGNGGAMTAAVALPHTDPLLQCMRAKRFIETAVGGFALPTQQRV